MNVFQAGLLMMAYGLGGTFAALILFYGVIRLLNAVFKVMK